MPFILCMHHNENFTRANETYIDESRTFICCLGFIFVREVISLELCFSFADFFFLLVKPPIDCLAFI